MILCTRLLTRAADRGYYQVGLANCSGKLINTILKKSSLAASEMKPWGKRKVIRACQFCPHICQANYGFSFSETISALPWPRPGARIAWLGDRNNFGGGTRRLFMWIGEGHEKFILVLIKRTRWRPTKKRSSLQKFPQILVVVSNS